MHTFRTPAFTIVSNTTHTKATPLKEFCRFSTIYHNKMKRYLTPTGISTGILTLLCCACNGNRNHSYADDHVAVSIPDTSIYAHLENITTDTLTFTSKSDKEHVKCAYADASTSGQIFGSITEGHLYSLLISPGTQSARHIVNLTDLSGQWFYDGENGRGFELGIDGELSPINNGQLAFRKWKICNGHLIFYYTDEQTIAKTEEKFNNDTTDIIDLSPEKLVFKFLGKEYHCQRQHEAIKMHFDF